MTIFSNWLHTIRNTLLALFLTLPLLFANAYAASSANIEATHCIADCGKVLVGAARIDFNSIRWNTQEMAANVTLEITSADYGFTGNSIYLSDTPPSFGTFWRFKSMKQVSIGGPPYGATMNHFFAPSQSQVSIMGTHRYYLSPSDMQSFTATGEGVADNSTTPAITLEIQTDPVNTCGTDNPCQMIVPKNGKVKFTVTPRLNSALVPTTVLPITYTLIYLRVEEKNTTCSRGNLTFADRGLGKNSFKDGDYYHYLEPGGPNNTPQRCTSDWRYYPFLVSVDKSFSFQTTNTRDTGTGYVEYIFYVNGHYDSKNSDLSQTQYPGSWKLFQLGNNLPSFTPPTASFNFEQTSFAEPFQVRLDATGSKPSSDAVGITNYQWQGDEGQSLSGQPVDMSFTQVGSHKITLTVTDDKGRTESTSQTISIVADPVAEFEATPIVPLTIKLDGSKSTPSSDANSIIYQWQGDEEQSLSGPQVDMSFNKAGFHTITLTVTDDKGRTATNNKSVRVFKYLSLDQFGYAWVANFSGQIFESPAHFEGGVLKKSTGEILNGSPNSPLIIDDNEEISVVAEATLAPGQENQPADLLVVVKYDPYGQVEGPWYVGPFPIPFPFGEEKLWKFSLSETSPLAVKPITLTNPLPIEIFTGTLTNLFAKYTIYVGYRVANQITFNPTPIVFEVKDLGG